MWCKNKTNQKVLKEDSASVNAPYSTINDNPSDVVREGEEGHSLRFWKSLIWSMLIAYTILTKQHNFCDVGLLQFVPQNFFQATLFYSYFYTSINQLQVKGKYYSLH